VKIMPAKLFVVHSVNEWARW